MLDFGSRMTEPAPERDDSDLFAAVPPREPAVPSTEPEEPEPIAEEEDRLEPAVENRPRHRLLGKVYQPLSRMAERGHYKEFL